MRRAICALLQEAPSAVGARRRRRQRPSASLAFARRSRSKLLMLPLRYAANQMHVMVSLVNQSVRSSTCDSYARLMMFLQRQSFISWLRTVP